MYLYTNYNLVSVFFHLINFFSPQNHQLSPLFIMEVAGQILESYYLHNGANHTKNERTCIPTRKKCQSLPKKHILRHLNSQDIVMKNSSEKRVAFFDSNMELTKAFTALMSMEVKIP